MKTEDEILNTAFEQAKGMYALGYDNRYIEIQLAEKKVPDHIIDEVIKKIKVFRKREGRAGGQKSLVYGLSYVAVAILASLLTFNYDSPVRYVCWGLLAMGAITTMKGLAKIIGL